MIVAHKTSNKLQLATYGTPKSPRCTQLCHGVRACCSSRVQTAGGAHAARVCVSRKVVAASTSASEPTPSAELPAVAVTFRARKRLQFGQVLKLVGGRPSLGAWDADKAPTMEWGEGDQWTLTLDLPPGTHHFKLAVTRGGQPADWEGGANRSLEVPAAGAGPGTALLATCEWGSTHVALEAAAAAEQDAGAATELDEPSLRPEDLTAEPYSPAGDEGEAPVSVAGKTAAEGATRSQQPLAGSQSAAATSPTSPQMGEGAKEEVGGEPAGGLKPSTEAAVKRELQEAALAGSLSRDDEDQDDYPGGGGGGGVASGSSAPPPASPRPSAGPGSSGVGAGDPPAAMQAGVAAAGLAALPVVAWSEWALRDTGCGLPPGPHGLLGAAEGLSYLVVGGVALWSLARRLRTGGGLPAGPANLLGAVQGGSWLVVASGLAVLALQWQAYGYIPSALPDSNCFGQAAASRGFTLATLPGSSPAAPAAQPAAPLLADASQPPPSSYSGALRVGGGDGRSLSVPQGNLLFSLEAALSQTGAVVEAAETAAATVAAAAAGQPPPAQVSAALHHLQHRAEAAAQLATVLGERVVALAAHGGAPEAAAAAAPAQQAQQAPPGPEPLRFEPPRHRVRAALVSGLTAVAQSQQVRAILEPMPLPAVARQAAAAAGGALEAVEQAAGSTLEAVEHEEELAAAAGRRALHSALLTARQAGGRLVAALPQDLRQWVGGEPSSQQAPAPAAPPKTATPPRPRPATAANGGSPAPAGRPASTAPAAARAAAAAPQPVSTNLLGTAVSDLREGFVGLWQSAKAFDPAQAAALLQERMHQQSPPPAPPAPKTPPAAARTLPKNE